MRAALLVVVLLTLTTTACRTEPPRAQSDARAARVEPPQRLPEVTPLQPPLPTPAPPLDAPAEDRGMPCRKIAWSSACEPREPPGERIEDLAGWHATRRLPVPKEDPTNVCYAFKAGPAREDGLRCTRMTQPSEGRAGTSQYVFRVVLHQTVSVVRRGRLETVLDVPHYVDVFDKESPVTEGPLFALVVEYAADGSSVTLREPAPGACERAKGIIAEELADEPAIAAWARFDEKLRARICASVGTHFWSGGSGGSFRRGGAAVAGSGP